MVRPDNGGAYALFRAAISCANTRKGEAYRCDLANAAFVNDYTRTLSQSLGDLADDDPDLAQKRFRGTRQRPLARANDGGRDLAGRLEGTDRQVVVTAEQRREGIDNRHPHAAFSQHAGRVAVADLDREAEGLASLGKSLPHDRAHLGPVLERDEGNVLQIARNDRGLLRQRMIRTHHADHALREEDLGV